MALAVEAGLRRDPALVVGMNEPYSPDDRPSTLDRHAVRRGLAPLMIEIRNDLIGSVEQGREWAERLAPLLQEALGGSWSRRTACAPGRSGDRQRNRRISHVGWTKRCAGADAGGSGDGGRSRTYTRSTRPISRHAGSSAMHGSGRSGRSASAAVISGHYSGWNLGLGQGFGSMFYATTSSPSCIWASPSRSPRCRLRFRIRAAPIRSRTAMGPGQLCHRHRREHRVRADAGGDRVLHRLLSLGDLRHGSGFQPGLLGPVLRPVVALNVFGVELSFRVTVIVTVLALAVLAVFYVHCLLGPVRLLPMGAQCRSRGGGIAEWRRLPSCRTGSAAFWPHCRSRCGCSSP